LGLPQYFGGSAFACKWAPALFGKKEALRRTARSRFAPFGFDSLTLAQDDLFRQSRNVGEKQHAHAERGAIFHFQFSIFNPNVIFHNKFHRFYTLLGVLPNPKNPLVNNL